MTGGVSVGREEEAWAEVGEGLFHDGMQREDSRFVAFASHAELIVNWVEVARVELGSLRCSESLILAEQEHHDVLDSGAPPERRSYCGLWAGVRYSFWGADGWEVVGEVVLGVSVAACPLIEDRG